MNIDKERELFERWAKTEEPHFTFGLTKLDFMIWQARASLLPTVEEIEELCLNDNYGLNDQKAAHLAQAISDLLEGKK